MSMGRGMGRGKMGICDVILEDILGFKRLTGRRLRRGMRKEGRKDLFIRDTTTATTTRMRIRQRHQHTPTTGT